MIEFISRLPQGYQEVEYIESSGTQYIDEEFRPSGENVRILTDYMYLSSPHSKSLFGAQTTNSNATFPITLYHTSGTVSSFYVGSSNNIINYTVAIDVRYLLDCHANNGAFTADLNGYKQTATYSGSLAKTLNMFMFTNNGQQGTQTIAARLYARKIWDNDELVRDYVPCYRKADNVAGLYDLVNNVFYINAGSGIFAVGSNVGEIVITPGGVIPMQYALRRRMMIKCDSKIEFEYTGNYTDNRDENGIGTVRFTSSGTLTVLSGKTTVSAYILGAGGGGAFYARGETHFYHASGGSGGYQTVEVELTPGTYDVVIGVGGTGKSAQSGTGAQARSGGNTTAFDTVSTGGNGGNAKQGGAAGTGGTPNGNSGSFVDMNYATEIAGGSPNGGTATQFVSKAKGGDGYVEITFS